MTIQDKDEGIKKRETKQPIHTTRADRRPPPPTQKRKSHLPAAPGPRRPPRRQSVNYQYINSLVRGAPAPPRVTVRLAPPHPPAPVATCALWLVGGHGHGHGPPRRRPACGRRSGRGGCRCHRPPLVRHPVPLLPVHLDIVATAKDGGAAAHPTRVPVALHVDRPQVAPPVALEAKRAATVHAREGAELLVDSQHMVKQMALHLEAEAARGTREVALLAVEQPRVAVGVALGAKGERSEGARLRHGARVERAKRGAPAARAAETPKGTECTRGGWAGEGKG